MQLQDLDVLKEIPGYPAILKAVLKTQIQMLVEQLSDQTGEESIILTASVNDGTLCHLGSNRGKDFLDGRDDLKSQFLKHCLNKDNKRPYPEETDVNPRQAKGGRYSASHTASLSETSQKKVVPSTAKKRKSATVTSDTQNVHVTPSPRGHSTPVSKETHSGMKNSGASVKLELPGDDLGGLEVTLNQNTDDETIDQTDKFEGLGHGKGSSGHRSDTEGACESENNVTETFDSSGIKIEPLNQDELEITGVEMGGDSTWSGGGLDYSSQQSELPTETGDASNQSGAYNYNAGLTETQKLEVLDLVSLIFQRHRGGDMTPLTGISPAAEATRAEVIRELKVPLLLDDERFSDVLVNPTMIREAEIKCKSAKVPERYLLNKVLELVFTAEEFTAARGTKSLNKHKQEAVKEYMNATCQALNIGNTEEIYTTILQNKIGNYRYKSKPVQTKAKKKTNQPGTSSEEQEVTIPSWMKVALEGSQDFE